MIGRRAAAIGWGCALAVSVAIASSAGASTHTEASNRAAAMRDASVLLGQLRLPAGAVELTGEPAGDSSTLAHPALTPAATLLLDRHRFWRVSVTPSAAIAYIRAAKPAGSELLVTGSTNKLQFIGFEWPAVNSVLSSRELVIEVTALTGGGTGARADAQEIWIRPRPASEVVPSGVTEIAVTETQPAAPPDYPHAKTLFTRSITALAQVRRIVALIDSLPTVQPGTIACPAILTTAPQVTFTFRSATHAVLAKASESADAMEPTSACDPLSFSIRGRQTPLLKGAAFLQSVEKLAHFTLPN